MCLLQPMLNSRMTEEFNDFFDFNLAVNISGLVKLGY
ncbi:hypothetical protein VR7878_03219 [Vibrio ruber DSM 16370]|uniref:Uncharacterized protein n=1 Tax=Vibrio ruber (strain DSM 16370 / JCM 11486 / BCRC 17186 / CECT 7878 / LMG 23124 / VR1) TaxID=1123498 RepID=A0A1R4LRT3_VIBR1|nr:hypothetical protein VR7878_03219 [Vibrio ruber DSM 16370]